LAADTAPLVLIIALILLFFSMGYLVSTLKQLFIGKLEQFFDTILFKTALRAMVLGLLVTAFIQSSSMTTSLVVPLAGAGLLTLQQALPFTHATSSASELTC